MPSFDYALSAELFPTRSRTAMRGPIFYKRFDTAAEAIRYAIEDLPPELLVGAYLEVDEQRFDAMGIRALYASSAFPLPRRDERGSPNEVIGARCALVLPPDTYGSESEEVAMSKGQHQSNREKRKPKQEKVKTQAASTSPFSSAVAKSKSDKSGKSR